MGRLYASWTDTANPIRLSGNAMNDGLEIARRDSTTSPSVSGPSPRPLPRQLVSAVNHSC